MFNCTIKEIDPEIITYYKKRIYELEDMMGVYEILIDKLRDINKLDKDRMEDLCEDLEEAKYRIEELEERIEVLKSRA